MPDIEAKERRYNHLVKSSAYARAQLAADAWCAAFVARKNHGAPVPTTGFVRQALAHDVSELDPKLVETVVRLRQQYRFLHLHLAFPDVVDVPDEGELPENEKTGWSGGFDVVLGNPPWEHTELKEKEFFAQRAPEIATASTGAKRKNLIDQLAETEPDLLSAYESELRRINGERRFLGASGRYPLCGHGRINTYAVFAETMRDALATTGRLGVIVQLGIATDHTTRLFFRDLVDCESLASLYGFENEEFLFPDVDHRVTFALLTIAGSSTNIRNADLLLFARQVAVLSEPERRFSLSAEEFHLLNPNTRTCPVFRTRRDADITKAAYRRLPAFVAEDRQDGNPWCVSLKQGLFNMTTASDLFRGREELEPDGWKLRGNVYERDGELYLPLYEGKMASFFDHRYGTYEGQTEAQANVGTLPRLSLSQRGNPTCVIEPRHWVPEAAVTRRSPDDRGWFLGWRKTARATDARTSIPACIPRQGVGDKFQLITSVTSFAATLLVSSLSSYALDYLCRQKLGGTDLTFGVFKQLPLPPPEWFDEPARWDSAITLAEWIKPRVLELTYTAWDMEAFGRDLGWFGPPFRWDDERRALMRAELDACFFHVYGIERDDVDYVMDTFPIVRRKEEAAFGEYRTKRRNLKVYDAITDSAASGQPYCTTVSPPPADPSVAHPASTRPDWADLYLPDGRRER